MFGWEYAIVILLRVLNSSSIDFRVSDDSDLKKESNDLGGTPESRRVRISSHVFILDIVYPCPFLSSVSSALLHKQNNSVG
jgi:hypothetical protein